MHTLKCLAMLSWHNTVSGSSPPVGFMVMVLSSTTVQLSWQYPESPNGEIRGYSILYSSIPDNEMMILNITLDTIDDTSNQTTIVSGLTPFTYYGFRIRAFSFGDQNEQPNVVHNGVLTDETLVRTHEDGKFLLFYFSVCYTFYE